MKNTPKPFSQQWLQHHWQENRPAFFAVPIAIAAVVFLATHTQPVRATPPAQKETTETTEHCAPYQTEYVHCEAGPMGETVCYYQLLPENDAQ